MRPAVRSRRLRHMLARTSMHTALFCLFTAAGAATAASIALAGCSSTPVAPVTADAASDAPPFDSGGGHSYGTAKANEDCEVNASCAQGLRCECAAGACMCKAGVRGEGFAGIGSCTTGNDCGSSICIDDIVCSDFCKTEKDCGPLTPRCIGIAGFSQKICARPPK
jgi:hypothetical protein